MTRLRMYTNEGEIALARKLNEVLGVMPASLTVDERVMFVKDALSADTELNAKHGEWRDTVVQEAISWWVENPTKFDIREERATVAVEFSFPVEVVTLESDARVVLDDKGDEIHEIVEDAVKYALAEIEKRIGRIAGEWSGVQIQFV